MEFTKDQVVIIMTGKPDQETCEALFYSNWWTEFTPKQSAYLQWHQDLLCMPFSIFHGYFEELIGRPVMTHEFTSRRLLQEELDTGIRPTLDEIMAQIPPEKLVVFDPTKFDK